MTRVFDPVLEELRSTLLRMGSRAESILDKSIRAVLERKPDLANEVAEDDLEIDRLDIVIDEHVLKALALQAPVAGDLRHVVAIKMIANDLERVGDIARNVAKCALRLAAQDATMLPAMLSRLASTSQQALRDALDAFSSCDADVAQAVLDMDDRIDALQDEAVATALGEIPQHPDMASVHVDIIQIAKNLERVGDHATNIAEDVILIVEARNVKHAEKLA
jgi:phosphate transport system protein